MDPREVEKAMGGAEAPLKIELGGVLRERVVGQNFGCRNCNKLVCSARSSDQCNRAKNARVTTENAKQEARVHMEQFEMEGQKEKPLWGRGKSGEEPPLTEVRCKRVKIAKRNLEPTGEGNEGGEGELVLHQNGTEEAKDTILYMIDQVISKNEKRGREAIAATENKQEKIAAMREKGKEV